MSDQLKTQLAQAMKIGPEQIMDYRKQEDGGYTVLLFNFQKFKGVRLVEPEPEPEPLRKKTTRTKRSTTAKHKTEKKES